MVRVAMTWFMEVFEIGAGRFCWGDGSSVSPFSLREMAPDARVLGERLGASFLSLYESHLPVGK